MAFGKTLVRYTIIAGLVGGTGLLIAGPDRVGALVTQTRQHINAGIDKHIEDPVALRAQLKSLEAQYPQRIAEVQGDLAELDAQVAQLNRELEVSSRVVELSRNDAEQMQDLIARAEEAKAGSTGNQIVRVVFNNEPVDLNGAYTKANKIRQVHNTYAARAEDIQRDLGYLTQQRSRLSALADQLQAEHAEFQTQMWQLDRQVDSIARNDRMIAMMEKREATLTNQSRYSANSLDQVNSRLADIRARQESRLEALSTVTTTTNYEDRAKFEIDAKRTYESGKVEGFKAIAPKATIIDITPNTPSTPATVLKPIVQNDR